MECSLSSLSPGDVLNKTRYRLLKRLNIPSSQQKQRTDWIASDVQHTNRTVIIHQIMFPLSTPSEQEKTIKTITQDLTELAQYPGFLPVTDVFEERDEYYIVQPYPEGESLASFLKQQGGTLPEGDVAAYGYQLCAMLSLLAQSHPPSVNGSLSPETIFINSEKHQVWLLHFPCFPSPLASQEQPSEEDQTPQQIQREDSPSSDLYSLAATLHHALTGYDPHEHQDVSYPPARRLNPAVTPQMEALLVRALHSSISQRLTDPSQMQQELSKLMTASPSLSPTSTPAPFPIGQTQKDQYTYQEKKPTFWITVGLTLAILLLLLTLTVYPLLTSKLSSTTTTAQQTLAQKALAKELNLELQAYRTEGGIGLSDGRLAFDIYSGRTKTDIDLKLQAASALRQGNIKTAINLLTQAIAADPADAEAQIYNEDLHISQSGAPYITIALGIPVENDTPHFDVYRADLEGAFLAQHEINTQGLLPHGLRLRLLLDNSGGNSKAVATTGQFIANRVQQAGNPDHIVAVVGWNSSGASIDARDIFTGIHLPLVSQTSSSVRLSGSSPYFFRVNPADDQQGETLGSFALQQLHAKTVLVVQDSTDAYSASLASAFSNYLKANNATVINDPSNFMAWTTTVKQYEQTTIPYAMKKQPDLIFLAGENTDGIRLAHALGNMSRANPTNTFLANLKILSGDALDTGLVAGQGNGPDAVIAKNFSQDMQRLIFAGFAHPDEWTFLKKKQPALFTDWSSIYQHAPPPAENAPPPGNYALMTYDAVQVIAKAATFVSGSLTGQSVRDALASLGHGNVPAFQGVSGRISFDTQGNPLKKALVLLDVEKRDGQNLIVLHQIAGQFF